MEKREFKVGDKVKIPKTKSTGMSINNDRIQRHLANSKFDYMTIKHIYLDKTLVGAIHTEMEGEQNWNFKAEDLEHYEEFVLPKCWFVLYNTKEEFDLLNQFYGKGWAYCDYENKCGYHNNGGNQIHTNNWVESSEKSKQELLEKGYIQITFQQFQKYVLKQETMEKFKVGDIVIGKQVNIRAVSGTVYRVFTLDYKREIAEIKEDKIRLQGDTNLWFYAKDFKLKTMKKEIIGYKLIKPEYANAAIEITGFYGDQESFIEYMRKEANVKNGSFVKNLKEAGVLDLWFEPVYQQEKQIIQMYSSNKGMFEIEVVDGKAYYRPENKELPKEWVRDIINSYDDILIQQRNGVNPYSVKIAGLHVGCYQNCKKQDWENVYKLLK